MSNTQNSPRKTVRNELALFVGLLFFGLVLLPLAIFFVGDQVFGEYAGAGFTGFFNSLSGEVRNGNQVAWFLVLSPYLVWQTVRLTLFLWRTIGHAYSSKPTAHNK